jgi:hypothetical protein
LLGFKTEYLNNQTIFQRVDDNIKIGLLYDYDTIGRVQLEISGSFYNSDYCTIFDNKWKDFVLIHNQTTYLTGSANTYTYYLAENIC